MEGMGKRQPEVLLRLASDPPAHPEVGMYQVVRRRLAPGEAVKSVPEPGHEREQLIFRHDLRRAGGEVHDPHLLVEMDDLGKELAVPAGKNVDLMAHRPEVPGQLGDVDVLAAGVLATQSGQRARVFADHRKTQGTTSLKASASSNAASQSVMNRSRPNLSRTVRRPASPIRRASSGSARSSRIRRMRFPTLVSIKPFSPSFITVTSSVVARATTGRPSSIASRTERGRLVYRMGLK